MIKYLLIIILISHISCGHKANKVSNNPINETKFIAHRGAWKNAKLPQNSTAALKEAIRLGLAGSEFDLHLTADEQIVINHDHDFMGIPIEEVNYSDLLSDTLSNGENIPTFERFLEIGLRQEKTSLVAELKPSAISKERSLLLARKVMGKVAQMKANHCMMYISFDYDILKEIAQIDPNARTMYLRGDIDPERLKEDGIWGLDYHSNVFRKHKDWINKAQKLGLKVNSWTVNNSEIMDELLLAGVDFISSDDPETLLDKRNKKGYYANWELKWSEEFNYSGLPDSLKWSYNIGGHGWGNNEKQYYTNADSSNVKVANGVLKIVAHKNPQEGKEYTSARLVTKNKGDWKYGKFEIKARLPQGRGLWPAIWMLPTEWKYGAWPTSGEIDIMEHVGYIPDSIYQTVHTKSFNHIIGTQVGNAIKVKNLYTDFHTYGIVWNEDQMDFFIDGHKRHTFLNHKKSFAEWPFDQSFHMILNLAVGGNWGGKFGIDDTIFPATFEIDYVRAYELEP